MKKAQAMIAVLAAAALWSCGNGNPKLQRVAVSPVMASASTFPRQQVQFTAQGTFNNDTTRPLTVADGLQWSSTDQRIATVDASGVATCVTPGASSISVMAPVSAHPIFSTTGSSTTTAVLFPGGKAVAGPSVTGSATLTCVLTSQ